jgi:glycosyltransferase involved in cell wall biosynthesis
MTRRPRILIVIENLPLERDARVKRECRALLEAGYSVDVICPRGRSSDPVAGVRLHTYPAAPERESPVGFVIEYAWAFLASALLTARVAIRGGVDAIQVCNPPDIFWLLAAPYRLLGVRYVFDHHDLSPELFHARYGKSSGFLARMLRGMERATLRTADHVVATNESVRRVSLTRGGRAPESVTVVRNGPELHRLNQRTPQPQLRSGRPHLAVWLGIIGPDDGVEDALHAIREFVHVRGRDDCSFAFIGDGERLAACKELAKTLGVQEYVTFTGWLEQDRAYDYLATADVALAADAKSPRSDTATMMKVLEYLSAGLPVVAYDVNETRVSAGEAAVYADAGPRPYAAAIAALLDDPDRRAAMGEAGRRRIAEGLSWDHQKVAYIKVYDNLLRNGKT